MKNLIKIIPIFSFIFLLFFCLSTLVKADAFIPKVTRVYFEKDGKPYQKPVSFTVNCYGYNLTPGEPEKAPGSYTPEKVFSFSATCPNYGCKIYEGYYLNYRHLDYCDLEGETLGQAFKIEQYATTPGADCQTIERPVEKDGKFYQASDAYQQCIDKATYSADHCFKFLVECPQAESTWVIDGKYYKRDPAGQYDACQRQAADAYDQQKATCDQYLTEIPGYQPEKDDQGNELMQRCELRFSLPSTLKLSTAFPESVIHSLICFLKKLFGQAC